MILALLSGLAVCKAARISIEEDILDTKLSTGLGDRGGVIRVDDGSRCLDVYGDNIHASDVTIYAAKCNGDKGQVWKHEGGALKNVASGRCLDVDKASSKNGANLILYRCNGQQNQQFQFSKKGIYQPKSSKCLDVDMQSNIKNVLLWTCKGSQNQKMFWSADWTLSQASETLKVDNEASTKSMRMTGKYQAYMQRKELGPPMTFGPFDGTSDGMTHVHMQGEPGVNCREAIAVLENAILFTDTDKVGDCFGDVARSYGVDPSLSIEKKDGNFFLKFGGKSTIMEAIEG
jgi:hypothetical protein